MVTNGLSFSGAPSSPWELFENASGPLKAPSGRFHFSWPCFWRWNWKDVDSLGATASWPGDQLNWKSNHSHAYVPAFVAHTLLAVLLPKAPGSLTTHGSVDPSSWVLWFFFPPIEQSVPFAMNNLSPCSNFFPFYLEIEELAVHTCEFNICSLVPAQTFLPLGESFFPLGLPRCCWHSQSPVSTLLCELVVQGRANGYSFTQPTQKPMPRDQRNLEQLKLFIEIAQRMLKI